MMLLTSYQLLLRCLRNVRDFFKFVPEQPDPPYLPPFYVSPDPYPYPWKVAGLFTELARSDTHYRYKHQSKVVSADYRRDRDHFHREFIRFTIQCTIGPESTPRDYIAVFDVHRSGRRNLWRCGAPNLTSGSVDEIVPQAWKRGRAHRLYPKSRSLCKIQFHSSKSPSVLALVVLLSTISICQPWYSIVTMLSGNNRSRCYWYSGAVWTALCSLYTLAEGSESGTTVKGTGKHSAVALLMANPEMIAKQIPDIQEGFLAQWQVMRDLAEKNKQAMWARADRYAAEARIANLEAALAGHVDQVVPT